MSDVPAAETVEPQPLTIAAAPDNKKEPRGKFIAPEKKTGLAKASATKPESAAQKKLTAAKAAPKKAAKKATAKKSAKPKK